jgi:hypothetical protein
MGKRLISRRNFRRSTSSASRLGGRDTRGGDDDDGVDLFPRHPGIAQQTQGNALQQRHGVFEINGGAISPAMWLGIPFDRNTGIALANACICENWQKPAHVVPLSEERGGVLADTGLVEHIGRNARAEAAQARLRRHESRFLLE